MPARPPAFVLYPLALFFSFVWTSAFVAGKLAIHDMTPLTVLCVRFALAAVLLLPIVARRHWRDPGTVRNGLFLGLLNNALTLGLVFTAMQHVSSALVVIITSCAPFITLLMAAAIGQERLVPLKLLGVAIGFGGVALIMGSRPLGEISPYGVVLCAIGTLCFSTGTLVYRRRAAGQDALSLTFWQAVGGALLLAPFSHPAQVLTASLVGLSSMLYLAVVVSIGAVILWLYLIRLSGAATASSYHLMNPVFGLLLGHLVFGDAVRWFDGIGVALVMAGLMLTTRAGQGTAGSRQASSTARA